MRVISIPPPVMTVKKIKDADEFEESTSFFKWLLLAVDTVKAFRVGPKGIRRGIKVVEAIEKAQKETAPAATLLKLEDADWEAMRDSFAEEEWNPKNARRIFPFLEAFEKAAEEK